MAKYKDIRIRVRIGADTLYKAAGQAQPKPEEKSEEKPEAVTDDG